VLDLRGLVDDDPLVLAASARLRVAVQAPELDRTAGHKFDALLLHVGAGGDRTEDVE